MSRKSNYDELDIEDIQHYADVVATAVSSFSPKISYDFAYEVAFDALSSCTEITTESIEEAAATIREEHELKNVQWN